jgi:hypothetical protein
MLQRMKSSDGRKGCDDEVGGALIEVERGQSESAGTVKGSKAGFGSASVVRMDNINLARIL